MSNSDQNLNKSEKDNNDIIANTNTDQNTGLDLDDARPGPSNNGIRSKSNPPQQEQPSSTNARNKEQMSNQILLPLNSKLNNSSHPRQVRAYLSAEETSQLIQGGGGGVGPLLPSLTSPILTQSDDVDGNKALPKQKSLSSDGFPIRIDRGGCLSPPPDSSNTAINNNNSGTPINPNNDNNDTSLKSFLKGRFFRTIKVTPSGHAAATATATPIHHEVLTLQAATICLPNNNLANDTCCVNLNVHHGSTDSLENICRICHDSPSSEKLIKPCLCKGSMGTVHRSCLEHWLGESGKGSCEICGQEFNTVRVPKYKGLRSFIAWIRRPMNPTDTRNFFFDLACFFILTPLALLSGWLCVVGAQSYATDQQQRSMLHAQNHQLRRHETLPMRGNRDVSNSTWTSIGLLSLTGTLVAAYTIWIFVAFRYHVQVWREWQQRNYIVTIVPLANGEFCFPPVPPEEQQQQQQQENNNNNVRVGGGGGGGRNVGRDRNPVGEGGGGGGRRNRNSDENMNQHMNPDDMSPTTRFIQELFIPSLANWEASGGATVNNKKHVTNTTSETNANKSESDVEEDDLEKEKQEEMKGVIIEENGHHFIKDEEEGGIPVVVVVHHQGPSVSSKTSLNQSQEMTGN